MRPPGWLVAVLVGALAGLVFASVSTYDFVQHLDRQVHSLHCSFIPGAGAETGASGCQAAMMSPYSSVFRTSLWGGIPISLGAMSVFAFLLFYGVDLLLTKRKDDTRATAFLALATLLPALMSVLMLTLSLTKLHAVCKLCAGVYVSSGVCLLGAVMTWLAATDTRNTRARNRSGDSSLGAVVDAPATTNRFLAAMFGLGVIFVVVPLGLYVKLAPDHSTFIGTCGVLDKPEDTYGVMVPVHHGGTTQALEILDPLCPACKAFEQRLQSSGFADQLDRRAILFPLDTTCNWMITENTHPGACAVSEAVLCAGDQAPEVIRWAFAVQDTVREQTKLDPSAAERIVKQRFPQLASCVGSPEAKSRLNKSLRWAVANNIRVLTPQLFIDGVKLCDEDVDLGLDFALARMTSGNMPHIANPVDASPPMPTTGTQTPATTGTPPSPATNATTPTATPAAPTPAETKSAETKPAETGNQPADTKPADTKPADTKPADGPVTSPSADKPAETKPVDPPGAAATTSGSGAGGAP